MATFFQTKISYLKQAENGSIYKKGEIYLLEAESFSEAEAKLQDKLEDSIPEYRLLTVAMSNITDVVFNEGAEAFYKTTVAFTSHDEDSGKEKKIKQPYLIQANSIEEANKILLEKMDGTVVDYESIKIEKTKIEDVFIDAIKEIKHNKGYNASIERDGENKKLSDDLHLVSVLGETNDPETGRDYLFIDAAKLIVEQRQGSVSLLQRKLKIGNHRASRIIDQLEEFKIVGQFKGNGYRDVFFSEEKDLINYINNL